MTETSKFWNGTTVGDALVEAPYDAPTEFAAMLNAVTWANRYANKGGVWRDDLNSLQTVVAGANNVRTLTGRGVCYGNWYQSDAVINTTIPTPGASTRVDYIVLRKDWTAQTVRVTRIAGVEGAGTPALVQNAGTTWDTPLATASITTGGVITITDMRQFLAEFSTVNLLTNGGFEIAQRGTGAFTANGAWTMDRWQMSITTSTVSVTQITSTIGSKGKSAQSVYTHAGGGSHNLNQPLAVTVGENIQLLGKTVSFSTKVKSTVAGTIRAYVYDNVNGYRYSSYNVGTGEETLTVTAAIMAATAATVLVGTVMDVATATAEVNDAMLVISPVPVDYVPLTPAEELLRCQRYYEKFDYLNVQDILVTGLSYTTTDTFGPWHYKVTKAVVPTITLSAAADWWTSTGAFVAVNVTSLSASRVNKSDCGIQLATAGGLTVGQAAIMMTRTTSALLAAESNP